MSWPRIPEALAWESQEPNSLPVFITTLQALELGIPRSSEAERSKSALDIALRRLALVYPLLQHHPHTKVYFSSLLLHER